MENKKGSGLFLSVIGVATLIVAIIGATFAYFTATAQGDPNAIGAQSTVLKLGLKEIANLKSNMIPSEEDVAEFAALDADWIAGEKEYELDDGSKITAQGQCVDQNGNEICSVYEFYIGNPSATTNMNIQGELIVTTNEFTNLHYAIYDENDNLVMTSITDKDVPANNLATALPASGSVPLTALTQQLAANPDVEDGNGDATFKEDDPSTYKPLVDPSEAADGAVTNVRHYKLVIWIHEMEKDQTTEDTKTDESGKAVGSMFAAGIKFTTTGAEGEELAGVTGVIAVAG